MDQWDMAAYSDHRRLFAEVCAVLTAADDKALPESHQVTDACYPVHCHSCDLDEPADGAYIVCGECGHVYRTRRALRREWRRTERRDEVFAYADWKSSGGHRLGWRLTVWWSLLTVRSGQIYSCPLCGHDW
jgi:hypothetical protein